jgi:putative ATP-dependent endonuclease of OLD family
LEIAKKICKPVVVVTDNDGNYSDKITRKYEPFKDIPTIKICADRRNHLKTLEPQIIDANKDQITILRKIFGISDTTDLDVYMHDNKTECALNIFDTDEDINFPQYILDAIE